MAEEPRTRYELSETVDADDRRDWLKHELASWPYVTDRMRRILDALHWRHRAAICLTYGQRLTCEEAGAHIGVSGRTVYRDIEDVLALIDNLMA